MRKDQRRVGSLKTYPRLKCDTCSKSFILKPSIIQTGAVPGCNFKYYRCPKCDEAFIADVYDSQAMMLRQRIESLQKLGEDAIEAIRESKEYSINLKERYCHTISQSLIQEHHKS